MPLIRVLVHLNRLLNWRLIGAARDLGTSCSLTMHLHQLANCVCVCVCMCVCVCVCVCAHMQCDITMECYINYETYLYSMNTHTNCYKIQFRIAVQVEPLTPQHTTKQHSLGFICLFGQTR